MRELIDQAPGVYSDVPEETYHRWAGASNSMLSALKKMPAHALYKMSVIERTTAAMKLGRALHCRVLEPEAYASRFQLVDRKTSPEDAVSLGTNDDEAARSMAESILADPVASELLADVEARELSIVWDDCESGVRRKVRLDQLCKKLPAILDIKTTSTKKAAGVALSDWEFSATVFNLGYHRQAAAYLEAAHAAGLPAKHFIIIGVDTKAEIIVDGKIRHAVHCFALDGEAIDKGARENSELLALWKDCMEKNNWPALPSRVTDLGLPAYAYKNDEGGDDDGE